MSARQARYSDVAVVRNLRGHRTGPTMSVMFRARRNRRKVDLAKKTGEVKASVKQHAPSVLRALGVTALSIGLGSGAMEGWQWATTTERFALKRISVVGNARALDGQLTRLAGLTPGQNLVAMDVDGVERSLATHPWVRSASVRRHLPSTLVVEISEHEPVAFISLSDLYLLNADGEPFKRAQSGEVLDLPLVTGVDREALVTRRDETHAQVLRGLAALEAYAKSGASKGHPASEVNVSDFGLTLVTTTGQDLVLGDAEVGPALERLSRVRRELTARSLSAQVIRLDNRSRPDWVAVRTVSRASQLP